MTLRSCIGDGAPEPPLGFLFKDVSANSTKDFTVEVSDGALSAFARLNDGDLEDPVGMQTADELYIGGPAPFSAIELVIHNDYGNTYTATLSGRYWTGTAWSNLADFTDLTRLPAGKPFGVTGRVSWTVPADWKAVRPISSGYPHGYWVMLKSSAALSAKTYISEARIWPVMEPLKKHRFALTVRDRMILLGRSDSPDRVTVSRALEECGFTGRDAASFRIGGQDVIVGAEQAFNQGFIAKSEDWYILNGYNPRTFSVERAEAAGRAPVNNRVIVRAPYAEADMKNLMGLYYLNHAGAWHFAGLKVYRLNGDVSWWDPASDLPRLDLDHLHLACGAYIPEKDRIVWAVPMIVSGAAQTYNNRLIVYDAGKRCWLPPFTISVASLAVAGHYQGNAPGKIAGAGLYGGDYHGRVLRLFAPGAPDDLGDPVNAYAETGPIDFGAPEYVKLMRMLTAYGKSASGAITVKVFVDGAGEPAATCEFGVLADPAVAMFAREQRPLNLTGRFFTFRVECAGHAELFGLQAAVSVVRDWGAM